MRPGKRRALDKENNLVDALIDQVEKIKASIRAKVEHPFGVIKRQFGYTKVRYLSTPVRLLKIDSRPVHLHRCGFRLLLGVAHFFSMPSQVRPVLAGDARGDCY